MMSNQIKNLLPPVIVVGPSHVNALGVVRSLGEMGVRPSFVQLGHRANFVRASKYLGGSTVVSTAEEIVPYLTVLGRELETKALLIATSDQTTAIVSQAYDKLSRFFYLPHSIDGIGLELKMDKLWQHDLATKYGIRTPKTWIIDNSSFDDIAQITYPCFTKSRNSLAGGKSNSHICYNQGELKEILSQTSDRIIVQEQIRRITEVDLLGFVDDEGSICMPTGYYYLNLKDSSYGTKAIHDSSEQIEKKFDLDDRVILNFIQATGYRCGFFSVEFLVDQENRTFFTEINLRNDAHTYGATQYGANIHYGLYAKVHKIKSKEWLRLKRPQTMIADQLDFFDTVYKRKKSIWQWSREVKQFDTRLLMNKRDPLPSVRFVWDLVSKKLFMPHR